MTLAVDGMNGCGHINTAHRERLLKNDTVLATKGLPERRSTSFLKVSGQMRSTTFKRGPAFSFTVIILD